ncbi:MAG: tRNA (adenosine(37)-N6)-threonylcarbamoyltransferase complex dimerization subunit type 1 TsaB [Clostridiaceae bacterium]|nr:tRNA (adenosine(37)-N6)-threonylcarbamoyltransferase complex dimerization subunit type 1 TsaB [Clostridiaceae bacterium]
MRALAVDTSTATAGIAVVDEKGLLAEFMLKDMKTHSQKLVPMMKEVLDSLRLTLSDIDVFAAVTGPGSFTGLRIGVTTIKTMAYALGKPVVGIPSLDALANAAVAPEGTFVCPIMDARNNQVYTALYREQNGLMANLSGYMGLHISELVKQIEEKYPGANILFAGDGVLLHRDFLKIELDERCSFMPLYTLQQMAAPAAQLALTLHARGESMDCGELVPFYLRPSQAEREYARKEAQESRDQ